MTNDPLASVAEILNTPELQGEGFVRLPKAQLRLLLQRSADYIELQQKLAKLEQQLENANLVIRSLDPSNVVPGIPSSSISATPASTTAGTEPSETSSVYQSDAPAIRTGQGATRPVDAAPTHPVAVPNGQNHVTVMSQQMTRYMDAQRLATQADKVQLDTPLNTTKIDYVGLWRLALEAYEIEHGSAFIGRTLNENAVNIIGHAVEMGMSPVRAAALAGISKRNWNEWLSKAKRGVEPYASVMDLIELAEARVEARHVTNWQRHSYSNWQASQSFLAKRFRSEWGDAQTISLESDQLRNMTKEELAEIAGDLVAASNNVYDVTPLSEADDEPLG